MAQELYTEKKPVTPTTVNDTAAAIWGVGLAALQIWIISWLMEPLKFYLTFSLSLQGGKTLLLTLLYGVQLFLLFYGLGKSFLLLDKPAEVRATVRSICQMLLVVLFLFVSSGVLSSQVR